MINIQNLHFGINKRELTPKSTVRSASRSGQRSVNKENSTPRGGDYLWNSSMPIDNRKGGILLNNTNDTH
tara:strand:+ start:232 stop:441 length:210 start_codon:yes stop_codon:yes gene_type:complete